MNTSETFTFETEAKQILELMAHSVYSNREVFLRELISNSSDALDKLRFEAIENKDFLPEGTELHIQLETNADERTLTIRDNGIGMSRDELISNIGTIARSGTKQFLAALSETKENTIASPDLIGQFGVGFYSAFMVSDKVVLHTRRAGSSETLRWESSGDGTYSVEEGGDEVDSCGTSVTLYLKEFDAEDNLSDFCEESSIRQTIKKYSDFVSYPDWFFGLGD